jgi:Glycosyl transferase family 2
LVKVYLERDKDPDPVFFRGRIRIRSKIGRIRNTEDNLQKVLIQGWMFSVKEIILVDDASEQAHLADQLEDYVAHLPLPVHILRTGTRVGLIKARLRQEKKEEHSPLEGS